MKKLIFAIAFIVMANCTLYAQANEQRGGGARGVEMMKQRLKEELKFSDIKVDSVAVVQQEFQMKSRELRGDQSLSDEQRRTKMEQYETARKNRLKAFLNEDEMKQLDAYMENMRKMRQQRQ